MSRKNNGASENGASETSGRVENAPANPADNTPFQPVYFSSLEVENFRCFGPKQILNLATDDGRPVQWTVILGENGVGKTTLLRLLADFHPVDGTKGFLSESIRHELYSSPKFFAEGKWMDKTFDRKSLDHTERLTANYSLSSFSEKLAIDSEGLPLFLHFGFGSGEGLKFRVGNMVLANMSCYGYGASRRIGKTNLSDKRNDDNCASLFDDNAELLNAGEWLLQADYAASRESPRQKQAAKQRDRIQDILISLLPDVENIRIAEGRRTFDVPEVEFKTPFGWVRLQSLSLGYRALITWMVDLASRLFDRYPDSPDPLAEPAVVLVDEIDLHCTHAGSERSCGF